MATMPKPVSSDPWTIAQKFIDATQKANQYRDYGAMQMTMEASRQAQRDKEAEAAPQRRYALQTAVNQANLEGAQAAQAAGLDVSGSGRYRTTGGKGAGMGGDPKIRQEFLEGVQSVSNLTNPIAYAALAGTGQVESGWSAANMNRKWSDPSEKGEPGTSGGLFSWRNERLAELEKYAASKGEKWGNVSARTQGEFYAKENPDLIRQLNASPTLGDAMKTINSNIRFAGWDRGSGTSGARFNAAANFLKEYGNASLTAKQRSEGVATAQGPATSGEQPKLVDEKGREYFTTQMDTLTFNRITRGQPGGSAMLEIDRTQPIGKTLTVRQYTGKKGQPPQPTVVANAPSIVGGANATAGTATTVAPTDTPNPATAAPSAPPVAAPPIPPPEIKKQQTGFDGTEDEEDED
jgi:hypothetical protein